MEGPTDGSLEKTRPTPDSRKGIRPQIEKRSICILARDIMYTPQQGEADNDISRESTCPEKPAYPSPSGGQDDQENDPAADMNAAPHLNWGKIW